MDLFRNRPFAFAAFLAAVLALAVFFANLPHRWIFAAILFACAVALLLVGFIRRKCGKWQSTAILTCLLAAVLLFGSWLFFNHRIGRLNQLNGEEVTAQGIVLAREGAGASQSSFALQLEELNGKRVRQKVILNCEYLSALRPGERIRLTGTIGAFEPISEDSNTAYRIADGFTGTLTCASFENCEVLASGKHSLSVLLSEWNTALSEKLVSRLGKREGGLAAALALGNRSYLSNIDTLSFRRAGIAHFLALSGLHVGILILAIERFLRLCRVPRVFRVCGIILLSIFYLAVTGASPSTIRAVCMAAMLSAAFLLRRIYDSPTAVFSALFGILAVQPYSIADSGLWLSFLAAGGIVIFVPAIRKIFPEENRPKKAVHPLKRMGKALLLSLSVGLFAFSATLPFSAFLFGEVSVLSVPATLLLSPLLSVALVLSVLCLVLPIPSVFFLAEKLFWLLRSVAATFSGWRGVTMRFQSVMVIILVVLTAVALLACAVLRFRKKIFAVVPIILSIAALLSAYLATSVGNRKMQVEYFSQKGNEYLLFSNAGKAVVADCSGGNKNYVYELLNGLHAAGCTELEELILTHYHPSATFLIGRAAAKIKIRTLVLPMPENEDEAAVAARLAEEAASFDIPIVFSNESVAVSGLTLSWVHDAGMQDPAVTVVAKTEESSLVWCNSQFSSAEQTKFFRESAALAKVFLFGQHGSTADKRRNIPQLGAEIIFVGESRSGATPFLPPEGTDYQEVSGKVVFSLS